MIKHHAYDVEPWTVRERALPTDLLAASESIFALANGHIGLRGNLDEGEPYGVPGSYLNGFYELHPLPYAEAGYGFPESGQTIINVTNGKPIRLLVDDEPFDVRYGDLRSHERVLDLQRRRAAPRGGVVLPGGGRRARLVGPARLVLTASDRRDPVRGRADRRRRAGGRPVRAGRERARACAVDMDPRAGALLIEPLRSEWHAHDDHRGILVHSTRSSGLRMVAAMDHVIEGPEGLAVSSESTDDVARVTATVRLEPGEKLRIVKFIAYAWSSQRSLPALRAQAAAALAEAKATGWDEICAEQRAYLDSFWDGADVVVEGDAELQQTLRFALFQLLQASGRAEMRAIPSKGLTGPGYDGHTFWDSESFVLQALTYTAPDAARDALRWRHATIDLARERATTARSAGRRLPVAHDPRPGVLRVLAGGHGRVPHRRRHRRRGAPLRGRHAGTRSSQQGVGLELLVETARLWRSLGHHDSTGAFRIDGVTGPDEYSAIADNNVYTNLMAEQNLRAAADAVARYGDRCSELGVGLEEAASWRDAAKAMLIPYDEALGVHEQAEGFTHHAVWDFAATRPDQYPLLLHFPYFDLYRKQVVKQADLVLAMHLRGDRFTAEEKARNFAYYEALTVRDSSLSACTQAVIAAEVGHLELAYAYLRECALIDIEDLAANTREGLHMAALAGTWIAMVAGFGGLRDHGGAITLAPRLPAALSRLSFRLRIRGSRLCVEVDRERVTYSVVEGDPVALSHHGEPLLVAHDAPVERPIPPIDPGPPPVAASGPPAGPPAGVR